MLFLGFGESDSQSGSTALFLASDAGHTECVRLLIDAGADKEAKDQVLIGYCFARARISIVFCFIQFPTSLSLSFKSCLGFVATLLSTHNFSLVLFLLSFLFQWCRYVFGQSDSQDGNTALIRAARKGHTDCARMLIDAGADKEAKDEVRCGSMLC